VTGARSRLLFLGVAFAAACQALPSAVPLSNTGGVLEDTGTDRDKRPPAVDQARALLEASRPSAPIATSAPLPVAKELSVDAGAPDAAVAALDAGTAGLPWAGEYYGSDKLVRHFDEDADDVELDDKAHTRVEERWAASLLISIVNSATGDLICGLRATTQGALATIDPGQSCFGDPSVTATVTDGRASLTGDRLVLDFNGKVVEKQPEDGDDPLEFRLEYHFDGRRR
jgi:hypothetical protein